MSLPSWPKWVWLRVTSKTVLWTSSFPHHAQAAWALAMLAWSCPWGGQGMWTEAIHVVCYCGVMQMKDNMVKRRCQGYKSVVFVTRRNQFLIFISHGHFVALTWHMIHIVFNLPPPSSITNMLAIRPAWYILELRHIPAWECASYFGKFEIAIMIVCLT